MTFYDYWERIPIWKRISLSGTYQSKKHHPEIWVDIHIKNVFENVERFFGDDIDLKICAIFHDIAKDDTAEKELVIDEKTGLAHIKVSHLNHELLALPYISKWKHLFDDLPINWIKVETIIRNHLKAHDFVSGIYSKKKWREFRGLKYFDDIIAFEKCDNYKP